MKYIKTYEANYGRYDKLKSYEKEWILNDGTPRSRYWLISNFKTLVEFSKLCTKESRRCILPVIDDIMRKGREDFLGIFIYDVNSDIHYYHFNDEGEIKRARAYLEEGNGYEYEGEIKVKDRCEIVVDTLGVDMEKYNL